MGSRGASSKDEDIVIAVRTEHRIENSPDGVIPMVVAAMNFASQAILEASETGSDTVVEFNHDGQAFRLHTFAGEIGKAS